MRAMNGLSSACTASTPRLELRVPVHISSNNMLKTKAHTIRVERQGDACVLVARHATDLSHGRGCHREMSLLCQFIHLSFDGVQCLFGGLGEVTE